VDFDGDEKDGDNDDYDDEDDGASVSPGACLTQMYQRTHTHTTAPNNCLMEVVLSLGRRLLGWRAQPAFKLHRIIVIAAAQICGWARKLLRRLVCLPFVCDCIHSTEPPRDTLRPCGRFVKQFRIGSGSTTASQVAWQAQVSTAGRSGWCDDHAGECAAHAGPRKSAIPDVKPTVSRRPARLPMP